MLAPAEVPATTTPRSWASTIASANGVPQTRAESLSWLPPVMKMPVARQPGGPRARGRRPRPGSRGGPRPPRRHRAGGTARRTPRRPRARARRRSGSPRSGRPAPPLAATKSLQDRALVQLVLGAADDHEGSPGHEREARASALPTAAHGGDRVRACSSSRDGSSSCVTPRPSRSPPPTIERELLEQRARRRGRGRGPGWPRAASVPDHALVSAAARTRQTWEALAGAAGWVRRGRPSTSGLYTAGPDTVLDLLRLDARGGRHAGRGRPQPDRGLPGPPARRRRRRPRGPERDGDGLPAGAVTVLEYDGAWADLGAGTRPGSWPSTSGAADGGQAARPQTGGAGVTMPASASAASISSRVMPSRYMIASR